MELNRPDQQAKAIGVLLRALALVPGTVAIRTAALVLKVGV